MTEEQIARARALGPVGLVAAVRDRIDAWGDSHRIWWVMTGRESDRHAAENYALLSGLLGEALRLMEGEVPS